MSVGNWITIGLIIITGYGTLKVYFNDLKHIKKDMNDMRENTKKIWDKLESNAERISRIEGRMNGGK
jgi:hypothetical protein